MVNSYGLLAENGQSAFISYRIPQFLVNQRMIFLFILPIKKKILTDFRKVFLIRELPLLYHSQRVDNSIYIIIIIIIIT